VATLHVLVVYPVAGAQTLAATAPFLLVAGLLLRDALRDLGLRRGRAEALLAAAALGLLALHAPTLARLRSAPGWRTNLPGARRIRVGPDQAAEYRWLVANLAAHADLSLSDPGLASLSIWSGVPLPDPARQVTCWYFLLDDAQQRRHVELLEAARAPMVPVWKENLWLAGTPDPSGQRLVRHLQRAYVPWRERGAYALLVRPAAATTLGDELLAGPLPLGGGPEDAGAVLAAPLLERPGAVEAWWRSRTPGVVLGLVAGAPPAPPAASLPLLYVGTDGLARATLGRPPGAPLTGRRGDDGAWHHAVVVQEAEEVALYLDGVEVDRAPAVTAPGPFPIGVVGAGWAEGWPAAPPGWAALAGEVGRVAVRRQPLRADEVAARWRAGPPTR